MYCNPLPFFLQGSSPSSSFAAALPSASCPSGPSACSWSGAEQSSPEVAARQRQGMSGPACQREPQWNHWHRLGCSFQGGPPVPSSTSFLGCWLGVGGRQGEKQSQARVREAPGLCWAHVEPRPKLGAAVSLGEAEAGLAWPDSDGMLAMPSIGARTWAVSSLRWGWGCLLGQSPALHPQVIG